MSWNKYIKTLKDERSGEAIIPRLEMIEDVQRLFSDHSSLVNMDETDRRKVAGYISTPEIDYGWFGNMQGAGWFKSLIKSNSTSLSNALDLIPSVGDVNASDYSSFVNEYKNCFKHGGEGIATSTRLLAMKRPDQFVCLNSKNRILLSKSFSIKQSVSFDEYWNSIILRIRDSAWWNVDLPNNKLEQRIWHARAAMLDGLFYNS